VGIVAPRRCESDILHIGNVLGQVKVALHGNYDVAEICLHNWGQNVAEYTMVRPWTGR